MAGSLRNLQSSAGGASQVALVFLRSPCRPPVCGVCCLVCLSALSSDCAETGLWVVSLTASMPVEHPAIVRELVDVSWRPACDLLPRECQAPGLSCGSRSHACLRAAGRGYRCTWAWGCRPTCQTVGQGAAGGECSLWPLSCRWWAAVSLPAVSSAQRRGLELCLLPRFWWRRLRHGGPSGGQALWSDVKAAGPWTTLGEPPVKV